MGNRGFFLIIMILIINTCIAFIVFMIGLLKKKRPRSIFLLSSWFVFIVPFMGIAYLLLSTAIQFLRRKREVDMNDVSFSQEREKIILPPEQNTEMNYVPIRDAMAVSDTSSLRKLLWDTMRVTANKSIASIAMAMDSDDTEASHYAASVIVDALSEFRTTAQNMLDNMRKYPEDVEVNLVILEYIYEVLKMDIMSDLEKETYIYTLDYVAENLFSNNLWYMTATHYLWMTDSFISLKNEAMAEKWASRSYQYRPNQLDTYKAKLHLYYSIQNKEAFLECLEELKLKNIYVDEEIINLFRIYDR